MIKTKSFLFPLSICLTLLFLGFFVNLRVGYTDMSFAEIWTVFWGGGDKNQNFILFELRLPRSILAILVGFGLSIAGSVFQAISKNDLADAGLLGVISGGNLALLFCLMFFPNIMSSGVFVIPVISFIGATLTSLFILKLTTLNTNTLSPMRLTLVGLSVGAGLNAFIVLFTMRLDPTQFSFINTWLIGSVENSSWSQIQALLPWVLLIPLFFIANSHWLDVLRLSDEVSISLGANIKKQRVTYLLLATALAAACVSMAGAIGFVGLICAHLARRIFSPQHKYSIILSGLLGGVLLIYADMFSKILIEPLGLPIGIVVALIGSPYFLYLLMRTSK